MVWNAFANQEHSEIIGEIIAVVEEEVVRLQPLELALAQSDLSRGCFLPLRYRSALMIQDIPISRQGADLFSLGV